jgi:Lon protease-like protein
LLKPIIESVAGARQRNPQAAAKPLAIFPLGSLLFPGGNLSLRIFEQRYMDMAKASLKTGEPFGICLIREGVEVGAPAVPEAIGTMATIDEWDMPQLGILQVTVKGGRRFRILSSEVTANGLIVAATEAIPDDQSAPSAALTVCAALLTKIYEASGVDVQQQPLPFDDAFWVSMRLTEMLPLGNAIKQKMLELTDATMRVEVLQRYLIEQRLVAAP